MAQTVPATTHFVIGTAGHIDHGKTSLVRALTGDDLDRLPEEKARGITIALGFTRLNLPSGRQAAFIDVPGHERLVRTMIAGATGLDAAMLCVSAVEGVMPQTREHLAILELLGIQRGVVALTMCDLVDEEMLELATLDVEDLVEGSFLEGAPIVRTAAGPEPLGTDTLLQALDALPSATRAAGGPFRLPIDRAFVQRGFGTVVTGTVRSGSVSDGEDLEVLPEGLRARVRGLQVHGAAVAGASTGQRTAINLAGVERDDLARGMVVVRPGEITAASILDCRYRHLAGAPTIADGARVRLLVGTAEVLAALSCIDDDALLPGADTRIQLRTETPLVALAGDRFVLRRESPVESLGGGVVLDPWARRARRRDRARVAAELDALEAGDTGVLLRRAGDAGLTPAQAALRGATGGIELGDRVLDPDRVVGLQQALVQNLGQWHQDRPLVAGAPRRDLRRGGLAHLSDRCFDALVARAADQGQVVLEGPRLRLPDFTVALDDAMADARADIVASVGAAGLEAPRFNEVQAKAPDLVHLLLDRGELVRVGGYVFAGTVLEGLRERVRAHIVAQGPLAPTDFKAMTGLSRKYAIPLLEWLDSSGLTQRQGDARVLAPGA